MARTGDDFNRALGNALLRVLVGDHNPDLSTLPDEVASLIRGMLGRLKNACPPRGKTLPPRRAQSPRRFFRRVSATSVCSVVFFSGPRACLTLLPPTRIIPAIQE
jgi:hypothetical protein